VGDSGGNSEDQNADRKVHGEDCVHLVSDGNEDTIGNWTEAVSALFLVKTLATICPCPEAWREAEIKGDGPINWRRTIQSSPAIRLVLVVLDAFGQIYSENSHLRVPSQSPPGPLADPLSQGLHME
jgi:hypothetical protein